MSTLLCFFSFTILFATALLSTHFSWLASHWNAEQTSSYECGFEPIGTNHVPFCMKFFLLAILFIVFDVEVSFIVPSLYSSLLMVSFVLLLLLGLVYEYVYGGLSWVV